MSDVAVSIEGLRRPIGAVPAPVVVDPDAAINIIYSSGTTGVPILKRQLRERVGASREALTREV